MQASVDVGDVEKLALTHVAVGDDATGDFDLNLFLEIFPQGIRLVSGFKFTTKRVDAEFAQLIEFLSAKLDQLMLTDFFFCFFFLFFFGHGFDREK